MEKLIIKNKGVSAYFYDEKGQFVVNLFGEIGWEFMTEQFMEVLTRMTDEQIILNIWSPGGDVYGTFAVYDYIMANGIKMDSYIYGLAGSAATVFACASQNVFIGPNSSYFIHNASGYGPKGEARADAATEKLIKIYKKKTGLSVPVIREMMDEETMLDARQAIEMGFCDKITKNISVAALLNHDNNFSNQNSDTMSTANKGGDIWAKVKAFFNIEMSDEEVVKAIDDNDASKLPIASLETVEANLEAKITSKLDELKAQAGDDLSKELIDAQSSKIDQLEQTVTAATDLIEQLTERVNELTESKNTTEAKQKETIEALTDRLQKLSLNPFKGEQKKTDGSGVSNKANTGEEGEEDEPGKPKAIKADLQAMLKRMKGMA